MKVIITPLGCEQENFPFDAATTSFNDNLTAAAHHTRTARAVGQTPICADVSLNAALA
jgi:hypothetical protein